MGQYQSQTEQPHQKTSHRLSEPQKLKRASSFEQHEGILKLRKVPFKNSVQISEHPPMFLENIPQTLADILESRYNTNKHFSEYQIQQLVQSVLYTLSFLESKNISYSNLSSENIHFDQANGNYKLLPLELIKYNIYEQAFKSKKFGLLSPELILGLRYKEKSIEQQIMNKSNVFTLGMILLQVATLQPSSECFSQKYDEILDDIITQRLQKVQEIYQPQIQRLIQIMIEYDYTKRMNLEELSILVNKTLSKSSLANSNVMKKSKSFSRFKIVDESMSQERIQRQTISRIQVRHEKPQSKNISPSRLKANTMLPVNYHQAPKRPSVQYQVQQFQPQPQFQVQPKVLNKQKSTRRFSCQYQNQQDIDIYYQQQPQFNYNYIPNQYPQYHPSPQYYAPHPQQPIYSQNNSYSQNPYAQNQNYQPQYHAYQNQYLNHQTHTKTLQEMNQTPKYQNKKMSSVIYPEPQKMSNTQYYQQQIDNAQYDFNPSRKTSFANYPLQSPQRSQTYEQPIRQNPYMNYQQPQSKQMSLQQQYQDSFAKNISHNNVLRNHNYTPPHRDTGYSYKQHPRYDRRSNELSDLSDSSLVKIKEQIAKSRQLMSELQKHESGPRR